MTINQVLEEISYLRCLQQYDKGQGKVSQLLSDPTMPSEMKLMALAVSLGHVAEAIHSNPLDALAKLGSLCVMWLESLPASGSMS